MKKNVFKKANILIPKDAPLDTWSVIACDQYSSEREYWERVREKVGKKPSTLKMIMPEAYLGTLNTDSEIRKIAAVMREYEESGIFREFPETLVYVERTQADGRIRRGIIGALDLEEYDYTGGKKAAVLASEGTVLDRLPIRVKVRHAASLELPHIMAFYSDKDDAVMSAVKDKKEVLYDFELMEGGGRIKGIRINAEEAEEVLRTLHRLADENEPLMIMGDGNHSLAAAKVYWDEIKQGFSVNEREGHPARYALIEINNVYDTAVSFEAIHRVIFTEETGKLTTEFCKAMPHGSDYVIKWFYGEKNGEIGIKASCIGDMLTHMQDFLDKYAEKSGSTIDYIHGAETARELSRGEKCVALILPSMEKDGLFETVREKGVFPRKSFSVGHAADKRYYLECRKIH